MRNDGGNLVSGVQHFIGHRRALPLIEATQTPLDAQGDASGYTAPTLGLGNPSADRLIVAGITTYRLVLQREIVSVTLDGNPMDTVVNTGVNAFAMGLFSLPYPSGTEGELIVTMSGVTRECQIVAWSIKGLRSHTKKDSDINGGVVNPSLSLASEAQTAAIALIKSTDSNIAWTGLTEQFDNFGGDPGVPISAATDIINTVGSATITAGTTNSDCTLIGATWR